MSINKYELMENFKKRCRDERYKVTPQRIIIYRELLDSKDHPDVETLYKRVRNIFPNISFDTVYRTLSFFHRIGAADIIDGLCPTRRYEGNTKKHFHYLCLNCNRIIDFDHIPFDYKVPEEIKRQFDVKNVRIVFEGTCKECKPDLLPA